MLNASMMFDVGNHEESFATNNEATFTHIVNNIDIKTKHCKII
jgi:hypothetical protein